MLSLIRQHQSQKQTDKISWDLGTYVVILGFLAEKAQGPWNKFTRQGPKPKRYVFAVQNAIAY